MMKVLVTGSTGFIGGALVERLLKKSWVVKAFVRSIHGDLRDDVSVEKAVNGVGIVVNCAAALPHHKLPDKDYWDTNVLGVKNVVEACIKNKVKKLVHISTVGVYGPTPKRGLSERAPISLTDIYTKTKYEGDKIIWQYIKTGGKAVIIRPTIAYGPGDVRPVFLKLFHLIKKGVNVSIGCGDNYLHTVYIDNLVDALVLAMEKGNLKETDFIIGDEKCPTMKEITDTIAKVQQKRYLNLVVPKAAGLLVGKVFGMERTVKFASENRRYSIRKARKLLGYKPKFSLEEGMRRTFEWYKANGYI